MAIMIGSITVHTPLNNDSSFPMSRDGWPSSMNNMIKLPDMDVHLGNLVVDPFDFINEHLQVAQRGGFHV
jgi:hypothetical protein